MYVINPNITLCITLLLLFLWPNIIPKNPDWRPAYISKNSIDEIYLCGFDTDGCILKTAFDLFENNIKAYILQDYCMSSGGEKYHYEAIDILKRSIGEKFII